MNARARMISFEPAYRQLSPAERSFVDAFVADLEAVAARTNEKLTVVLSQPIQAADDARTVAMLDKALVRAAIVERVRELTEDAELTAYKTLKELRAIAYSSIGNYMRVEEDGSPIFDLAPCTPEQLSAIKSIKYELNPRGGHKFEFVLHDKLAALGKVMDYQGLSNPDNDHWRGERAKIVSGSDTLPVGISDNAAADTYSRLINS